jgi:hypothetical protein
MGAATANPRAPPTTAPRRSVDESHRSLIRAATATQTPRTPPNKAARGFHDGQEACPPQGPKIRLQSDHARRFDTGTRTAFRARQGPTAASGGALSRSLDTCSRRASGSGATKAGLARHQRRMNGSATRPIVFSLTEESRYSLLEWTVFVISRVMQCAAWDPHTPSARV